MRESPIESRFVPNIANKEDFEITNDGYLDFDFYPDELKNKFTAIEINYVPEIQLIQETDTIWRLPNSYGDNLT
ncbi:hypothetical protein ES703_98526 [subsurface metagenome]